MDGWYDKAVRLPITTHEYFDPRELELISICNHITDGWDSRDFLQHADNQSSVHFLIREENGVAVVYQFMPVTWAAWGNGRYSDNNPFMPQWIKALIKKGININHATVSIEHERKWPFTTPPSDVMMAASIGLQKWLADNFPTIKRDRDHIIGHYQIDHVSRAHCPGGPGGRLFPFDAVLAALNAAPAPLPAPIPDVKFPETNVLVKGDFYEFWVNHGGLPIFGYPIRAEKAATRPDGVGISVQSFERLRFERHPRAGGGTEILLGRSEAERLDCAHE